MDVDVAALQQELQQLRQQRSEATDRLRSLAPRGRNFMAAGRGRGPGAPMEEHDRGFMGRGHPGVGPARQVHAFRGGPALRGGFGPGRGYQPDHRARFMDGPGSQSLLHKPPMRDRLGPPNHDGFFQPEIAQPPTKKRVLSAVVVDGEQRVPGQTAAQEVERPEPISLKRPPPSDLEENPAVKKRNQRMFGALLGTLQKFRTEQAQHEQTDNARKQAEALKRADERRAAESQRLKDQERAERQAKRREELDKIRELNLQAEMKGLEIIYAKRIAYRGRLQHFLSTTRSPPLFWLPAKTCPQVERLFEQQQEKAEAWKAEQLQALQAEKDQLRQQSEARQAAFVRPQPAAQQEATGVRPGRPRLGSSVVVAADRGEEEGRGEEEEEQEQREAEAAAGGEEEEEAEDGAAATNGHAEGHMASGGEEKPLDDDRYVAEEQHDHAEEHEQDSHEDGEDGQPQEQEEQEVVSDQAGGEEEDPDDANMTSVEELLR